MFMEGESKYPFYLKFVCVLLSLSILVAFFCVAQNILIPFLLALLFAILLRPVTSFFNRKLKLPHVIAIMISVVLFMLVIVGIIFFVTWKMSDIAEDWDKIKINLNIHYHHIQRWVKQEFNISYVQQEKYVQQASKNSIGGSDMLGNTMSTFTDILLSLILVPVYTFLFLLYRNLFLKFLSKLFKHHRDKLKDILCQIKISIQSYLVGILIEVGIVSTLTSIGFFIIGIHYPVLLGVITGVLNLIPYIGILVAGGLSIIATLTSSTDLHLVLGVVIVNIVVQFIDNNVLVPFIVSSKVKINALVSIISIIVGGAIGGVAGMFLALPITAILKVIFDRVDGFEPWGFLLGDQMPKTYEWGRVKFPRYDVEISYEKDDEAEKISDCDNKPQTDK